MKRIIPFLLLVQLALNVSAQEAKKSIYEPCIEGLRTAAFNTYSFSSENDFRSFLSIYFSMTNEQRLAYRNSNSTSAGLKLLIDAIPIGFSGSNATSEEKEEYRRLEQLFKQNQEVYSSDLVKIYSKIVSPEALRAYETCITSISRTQGGESALSYSIEGDPNDEFVLIINWRPINELTTSKVASFEFPGLMLRNGAKLYNGADFKAFTPLTQTFKRTDPSKSAAITVAFTGLGQPIRITLDPVDKFASMLPLGTIVASALNYEQFTQQTFNEEKSIWAPADGRSVSRSKYGLKNSNVPDLRGQFLRGLNQFYSPGEPITIVNGADPNDRYINNQYSYQKQDIKPHDHGITDKGHNHASGMATTGVGGSGTVAFRPSGFGTETSLGTSTNVTNITINTSAGKETRPNNIAVYYYIKIN